MRLTSNGPLKRAAPGRRGLDRRGNGKHQVVMDEGSAYYPYQEPIRMEPDKKSTKDKTGISRRDFSRVIALAAATAAIPESSLARPTGIPESSLAWPAGNSDGLTATDPNQTPGLSPVAEARVQIIFARYGNRLSDEQKADVKRLIAAAQKPSEDLHSFHLENSDEPAMIYTARMTED
jgi:hypothetical protein